MEGSFGPRKGSGPRDDGAILRHGSGTVKPRAGQTAGTRARRLRIDLRCPLLAGLRPMPYVFAPARRWAVWMVANSLILAGCSLPYIPGVTSPPPSAGVDLRDANGRIVGSGVFLEQGDGVREVVVVKNITTGVRGNHDHEVDRCTTMSFLSGQRQC